MNIIIGNSFSRVEGLSRTTFDRLRSYVAQKAEAYGQHQVADHKFIQRGKMVAVKDAKGRLCPVFTRKGQWPNTVETAEKLRRTGSLIFKGNGYRLTKHIDARGSFPTGLLPYVQAFASKHRLNTVLQDTRVCPPRPPASPRTRFIPGTAPIPRPSQINALEAALCANQGILSLPTATGKSYVMALLVDDLQLKTLIVVPTLGLKQQLSDSFNAWFGPLPDVVIENIDSPRLKTLKGFDVIIIDEAHRSAAKRYRTLNKSAWSGIYYRFYFTATPFRSNEDERLLLEGIAGQVVYRLPFEDAVADGACLPVQAYFYDLPEQEMRGAVNDWHAVYSELIVNNDYRNRLICWLLARLESISTLCLVKEVDHGRRLSALSGVPFACGEEDTVTEALVEFNSKASGRLIGTTGVLGEGMDTRPAEWVILAAGGKSKVQFMQQVGRVLRNYPGKTSGTVILFRDKSNKYLLDHYRLCVQYLKQEYGIAPVRLELPEDV